MKKKGFTLVELLAVIAILAILVIVAMPNVLGMFGQAKTNTFVTEVQKYMDTAKTTFVQTALTKPAQNIVFSSVSGVGDGTLDMDGTKDYYIVMDRHGNFTRVLLWDSNLCYDSEVVTGLEKTEVVAEKVKDSATGDGVTVSGGTVTVNGCKFTE